MGLQNIVLFAVFSLILIIFSWRTLADFKSHGFYRFLGWESIYLKNTDLVLLVVALLSSLFLYLTARSDEKECIRYFGDIYRIYMKNSKRFIPFVV